MKLDSKQLEGFVLLRDGLSMAADGINKIVETTEPKETQKPTEAKFNGLKWIMTQGKKAPYEQTAVHGEDAHILYEYLKAHNNFCELFGYKIWIDRNPNLIDRRKK